MPDLTRELVDLALEGDPGAQRQLVAALTPDIQWSVASMLRRWRTGSSASRNLRQEVEDMVQEVFVELFQHDGRTLRRWDPERLSLEGFISYVARIRTAQVLRSRRSPWREQPSAPEDLPMAEVRRTPEDNALSQDELRKVYLCVQAGLHAGDLHLFDLFFVREHPVEHVAEASGRTVAAVYKWRSRLYKRARKCRELVSKRRRRDESSATKAGRRKGVRP